MGIVLETYQMVSVEHTNPVMIMTLPGSNIHVASSRNPEPDTAVKDSRGFDHYSFLCQKQITVKCYVQGDFHHRSLLSQKYMISWLLGLKRQLYSTYLTPDKAVEVSLCL